MITYRSLWENTLAWRDQLSQGLRPGSVVAVVANGSPEFVPAFLGARAAHLVPLLLDTLVSPARRDEMIRSAGAVAVLDAGTSSVTAVSVHKPLVLPAHAGYITFSSGSQGNPKGIIGNAYGLAAFLSWERKLLGLGEHIRGALLAPASFDVVLRDVFLPLVCGGVLCAPPPTARVNPAAVIPWLADNDVNVTHIVPSLSSKWAQAAGSARVPSLRWSVFAGEPLHARHVGRWRAAAPLTRIVNLYGPSETTLAKFFHIVPDPPLSGLIPVGRPLPGVKFHTGEKGRIVIETPDGSLGYLPGSAGDHSALVRQNGVTRFVTEDRGRIGPDGVLYVEGRLDGLVKRNGVFVDLTQVTAHALADPDVAHAVCVQVNLDASGEVVLAVECATEECLSRISRRLRRTLGPAMPNEVVRFDSLPMLPNGKSDPRAVRSAIERRQAGAGR